MGADFVDGIDDGAHPEAMKGGEARQPKRSEDPGFCLIPSYIVGWRAQKRTDPAAVV